MQAEYLIADGRGMNCGIHDALNLVEKRTAILKENADADAFLDRYNRQRRAAMTDFVQRRTIRDKLFIEAGTEEAQRSARSSCRPSRRHAGGGIRV